MDITRIIVSKGAIINSLERLLDKEKSLEDSINKTRQKIKNRKSLPEEMKEEDCAGVAILYKSANEEDIAFAFAAQDYMMLREVRNSIRSCLQIAFHLKMHIDSTPHKYEHKSGVITKNYSEYILELNTNPRYK